MANKWAHLKGEIKKFEQEPGWAQEIDEAKRYLRQAKDGCKPQPDDEHNWPACCEHGLEFLPMPRITLCGELNDEDLSKKKLEADLHSCNTRREAISQLLLEQLEAEGTNSIRNAFGTFFIGDEPYSKVIDKQAYLKWIGEQGLSALLSVPYQSTNAQVKARLEEGQPVPPGIEVYIKSSIRRRQA